MQRGEVDMCIVGTDRTLSTGDVANKIGTYLKALAAHDNNVPFYVALPSSTIDWDIKDFKDIPIEERNSEELTHVEGLDKDKKIQKILNPLGFPKNEKKYHPHITIARAKYPQKKTPDISTFLNTSFDPIPFPIKKVQFISSELFPNGPVYTILSTHFFGNNSV